MTERSVNLEELLDHKLLWGDLLWEKKSGKTTCIGSCGDFADIEFIEKLIKKEANLKINSYTDWKLVKDICETFKSLEACENEKERVAVRESFVGPFLETFLSQEKGSYIDWFTICFRTFYKLPEDIEEIYYMKNSEALKRSMAVASMTTLIAFTVGHLNFDFLQKIYNCTLIMDLDFVIQGMSEYHMRDLEKQRVSDDPSLDGRLLSLFKHHGANVNEYINRIANGEQSLINMVKFHHEQFNCGAGPEGIFDSEVGDLPQIISFVERLIPYKSFNLSDGDANGSLTTHMEKIDGYHRIKSILRTELKGAA